MDKYDPATVGLLAAITVLLLAIAGFLAYLAVLW